MEKAAQQAGESVGGRVTALYEVRGSERDALARAERIALDQTVEAGAESLTADLRRRIVGRVEHLRAVAPQRFEVTISYSADLIGDDCTSLLNLLFGTSSLRRGVRLIAWSLPDALASRRAGPRFGLPGLRAAAEVPDRALVCAVLKPLGRSPQELAELAFQFSIGGVDLIKDDQGLMDQSFCRFGERVTRCAEAVAQGAAERGRPCLYLPHVSGALDVMRRQAQHAKEAGAGGLLVAPGLAGFDSLRALAEDQTLALPIASHPAFLGTYALHPGSGLAPAALYGQLPRLAGADLSIYPRFGAGYGMSRPACRAVAQACLSSQGPLRPTAPTAAGRIGVKDVKGLARFYGRDVVFILGSRIQQDAAGVARATRQFMKEVERCTRGARSA